MAGLKIQVNGKGLIPRGYGIAPRKDPFIVNDVNFIGLILNTAGLSVRFINPVTGKFEDVTKKNLKRVWETYSNISPDSVKPVEEPTPDPEPIVNEPVVHHVVVEDKVSIEDIPIIHNAPEAVAPAVDPVEPEVAPTTEIPDTTATENTETAAVVEEEPKQDQNNKQYNNGKKHHK